MNSDRNQPTLPYDEIEIQKLYLSIGEVAELLTVSPSLIRYWEGEFPELKPKKNKRGNRLFTKEDISILRMIYYLTKEKGFTIEGAKNQLKKSRKKIDKQINVVEKLKNLKSFLAEIKEEL